MWRWASSQATCATALFERKPSAKAGRAQLDADKLSSPASKEAGLLFVWARSERLGRVAPADLETLTWRGQRSIFIDCGGRGHPRQTNLGIPVIFPKSFSNSSEHASRYGNGLVPIFETNS